ncbi:MAG: VWA domain-containing protein [Saprospiraceae bacterium]|jgi:Ca-activated chloride channel family protein|nr:VWA domain-containing protein [Saprospiraceae bacterium]
MKNFCLFLLLCVPFRAFSQTEAADKTLSPYFMVTGTSDEVDALPLKKTAAEVNVAGVIADVVLTQTYVNTGKTPLEAIYVFPASSNAAVYGLSMRIGNRLISAKIAERNQARADYEKAKSDGKRATLLEQERPNVFQMNVANIMPGDTIHVALRYTELLVPESGHYEFVFPTVVGPRYTNAKSGFNDGFTEMPYQHSGDKPQYNFDISMHLAAGMHIHDVKSPSHRIRVNDHGVAGADVMLDRLEARAGNRDFILRYSLRQDKTDAGLLLFDDGKEKFFLCMAQPPKQPALSDIPPREYIFVVDVSGSMNGFPLNVSKKLLSDLIGGLRADDRFNVILFAGTSNLLAENSLTANQENIEKAKTFIDKQEGSGGTELLPALERALKLPRNDDALSRSIVVVTDGYIDVEAEAYDLVRNNLDKANLFAFGIGSSVNRFLMEGLAHVGGGVPFIVTDEAEGKKVAETFRRYIATPVLSQVKIRFPGFDAYDVEPSHVPDVFAQRPIVLVGKWKGDAKGEIVIKGYSGKKAQEIRIPVQHVVADSKNAALKYIWARERIKMLSDYNSFGQDEKRDEAVTQLGLKYNLLTAFTSFIAIDEVIANDGKLTAVKQPLPLPQGVSDLAVGFDLGITGISGLKLEGGSQSAAWVLLCGILLLLVVVVFRKKIRQLMLFGVVVMAFGLGSCGQAETVTYCEGENIAFMLGEDRSNRNPYFANASAFFRSGSTEETEMDIQYCPNLKAVHQYLQTHRPVTGPWKQVHLIVHSNEWTGLRVAIDDTRPDRSSAAALEAALREGAFRQLPAAHFDSATCIVVDGCNAGRDTVLLRALSRTFSGIPVHAARFFNIFEKQTESAASIRHYLADYQYVVFPNGTFPGNKLVAQQLATKYPADTTNWAAALQRTQPRFAGDTYVHYFSIPVQWITLYNDTIQRPKPNNDLEKLNWVRSQPELMQQLSSMRLRAEDFQWNLNAITYSGNGVAQPAIQAEGLAKIYGIVQPLKNEQGQLAQANFGDARYYNCGKF